MTYPFFTIGHSTHPIGEFIDLLRNAEVRLIADVRTVPRSRTNPQYNSDVLPVSLSEFQIGYTHVTALGGRRGRQRDVPESVNAFWQNQSFHNYADYALNESFHLGLNTLRNLGHTSPCAIMCAEAVWWRCHRRIITDYLIVNGETVFHILSRNRIELAHITDAARPGASGALTYPAHL
jgi:uncharacterized protein (DUF488 family)